VRSGGKCGREERQTAGDVASGRSGDANRFRWPGHSAEELYLGEIVEQFRGDGLALAPFDGRKSLFGCNKDRAEMENLGPTGAIGRSSGPVVCQGIVRRT